MRVSKNKRSLSIDELAYNSSGELSTVSANGLFAKPSMPSILKGGNHAPKGVDKKSVRFDESLNFCSKIAANYRRHKECWYTEQDCKEARNSAKSLCRTIKSSTEKVETHYISVLSDIYQTCCEVKDEELLEKAILDTLEEDQLIKGLIASDAIGLERLIVDPVSVKNIVARRKYMWKTLNEVQRAIPASNLKVEAIRRSMEPISLPSRRFAGAMGKAFQSVASANRL